MLLLITNKTGAVRTVTENGKQWLVAPVTLIVSGVLNGSQGPIYYSPKVVTDNPLRWNKIPLVLNHPKDENGNFIPANTPGIISLYGLGEIRNAAGIGSKLSAEAWFDVNKTKKVDNRIYNALKSNKQIEISTGMVPKKIGSVLNGSHNGKEYKFTLESYDPDHLAILPDSIGACSLKDGCGVLANKNKNNANKITIKNTSEGIMKESIWNKLGEALGLTNSTSLINNEPSFDDIKEELRDQIRKRFSPVPMDPMMPYGPMCYIEEVYRDYVIYELDGRMYKLGYTTDMSTNEVELSQDMPVEVEEITTYEPIGNAVTKKEGDVNLPSSAYAHVPNPQMPSTWKLRIDDAAHVAGAVAALGPGFRGNKVQLPAGVRSKVISKVRRAWKKFHPDKSMNEMPMVLRNESILNNEEFFFTDLEPQDIQVIANSLNNSGVQNMTLAIEHRKQIISGLLANCNCSVNVPWKGKTEAVLNTLSDDTLVAYDEVRQNIANTSPNPRDGFVDGLGNRHIFNAQTNTWNTIPPLPSQPGNVTQQTQVVPAQIPVATPVVNTVTQQTPGIPVPAPTSQVVMTNNQIPVPVPMKPKNMQEWMAIAPDDAKMFCNTIMEESNRIRGELIENLASVLAPEHREGAVAIYNQMDIGQLRTLAQALPPKQIGQAQDQQTITNGWFPTPGVRPYQPINEEPLLPPVYKFGNAG